jgi:hypothetical protein
MRIIAPKRLMGSVYPTVRNGGIFNAASLDLQFARTKTLDSRITFTRASSGTYVGADGLIKTAATNEARFDHNPTTGESLGLLVEESRTNLLTYSQEFDNAIWLKDATTISANTVAAPDETTTADKIIENSSNAVHAVYRSASLTATTYTYSVFLKQAERSWAYVRLASVAGQGAYFNLSTGVIGTVESGITASISKIGNGWFRCSVSILATASGWYPQHGPTTGDGVSSYQGNGVSGIYAWGAQLEAGAFPTSYIPTTSSTVTRSADVASITGTNYSSVISSSLGTWYSEVRKISPSTGGRIFDSRNAILFASANSNGFSYTSNSASQINGSYPQKGAVVYNEADVHGASNGTLSTTNTGGRAVTHTYIDIGSANTAASNVGFINAPIARLTYWPQRLSDATLQEITR